MNKILYASNIECTLEDGTTIEDVKGWVIDNKRVYKTKTDEILTGTKKVKTIHNSIIHTDPINLLHISQMVND